MVNIEEQYGISMKLIRLITMIVQMQRPKLRIDAIYAKKY